MQAWQIYDAKGQPNPNLALPTRSKFSKMISKAFWLIEEPIYYPGMSYEWFIIQTSKKLYTNIQYIDTYVYM